MNNKEMDCQVVCAEESARRIEGAMQMAHTQKSGAQSYARQPFLAFFILTLQSRQKR